MSGVKIAIPRNKRCLAPKIEEKLVRMLGGALNAGYTYLRFAASAATPIRPSLSTSRGDQRRRRSMNWSAGCAARIAPRCVAIRTSTARRYGTQRFRPAIRLRYGGRSDSIERMQELRSLELFASDRSRGVAKLQRASDNTAGKSGSRLSPASALPSAKLCAKNQLLIVRKPEARRFRLC